MRRESVGRLNRVPGVGIPEDDDMLANKRPTVTFDVLVRGGAFEELTEALAWLRG